VKIIHSRKLATGPSSTLQRPIQYSPALHPIACIWPGDAFVSGTIANGGLWDAELAHVMVDHLRNKPTSLVIDAGCNVGQFSLLAAASGHFVAAIDALHEHAAMVNHAAILNGFQDRIWVQNVVLAAKDDGKATVTRDGMSSNMGGITPKLDARRLQVAHVRTATLNALLRHHKPSLPVSFFKLDVEGFEPLVLEGAQKWLVARRPQAIALEITPQAWRAHGYNVADVLQGIMDLNYTCARLYGGLKGVPRSALRSFVQTIEHLMYDTSKIISSILQSLSHAEILEMTVWCTECRKMTMFLLHWHCEESIFNIFC
jgi:FkbM family methyltransferase